MYELVAERGPPGSNTVSSDPIEREINEEDKELAREARRLRLEELIQRRNNKLTELRGKGETKKELAQVGNDFLSGIMDIAKVDPVRAKEFLASLTQEDIMKLNLLASSGKGGGTNLAALLPLLKGGGGNKMEVKDIIGIVKMMQPPPEKPTTIGEVATLMKVVKEMDASPQQNDPLKTAIEYLKPVYDLLAKKDNQFYTEMLKNAQQQNTNPLDFIKQIKEFAPMLGMVPAAGSNDQNLELTKMKLDQERWRMEQTWNQTKALADMKLTQQSDKDKWKMIQQIAVPAIKQLQPVISAAVNAGKTKLNTVATRPPAVSQKQAATAFLCPACAEKDVQTVIDVSKNPEHVVCQTCKSEFGKAPGAT